jgi:hypothetical protein
VSVSVSPPKLLKRISSHKQNHMALLSRVSQLTSTNMPQSDKSHIHRLAPSPKPCGGWVYASSTLLVQHHGAVNSFWIWCL